MFFNQNFRARISFMKVGPVTRHIILRYTISTHTFPHLLLDLSEIGYKRYVRTAVKHWWISWKSARRWAYFSFRCNWICIDACAVKPYDIWKVKNALVNSVCFVTQSTFGSPLPYAMVSMYLLTFGNSALFQRSVFMYFEWSINKQRLFPSILLNGRYL